MSQADIARYFIMNAPTGEVDEVITDVKKLVEDPDAVSEATLRTVLRDYNIEQMVFAEYSDRQIMVSRYGLVSGTDDNFEDPETGKVLTFDHIKRQWTGETEKVHVLDESIAKYRASISSAIKSYVEESYKAGKMVAAVYGSDNGQITICLSGKNVNLGNFWSGSWRAVYTVNVSSQSNVELRGSIKLNAHYFEDGNVQLNNTFEKVAKVNIYASDDATGKEIAKVISNIETDFQNNLEEMYVDMHRNVFKSMRRFLPINKQKMIWNSAAHSLAQEVSK